MSYYVKQFIKNIYVVVLFFCFTGFVYASGTEEKCFSSASDCDAYQANMYGLVDQINNELANQSFTIELAGVTETLTGAELSPRYGDVILRECSVHPNNLCLIEDALDPNQSQDIDWVALVQEITATTVTDPSYTEQCPLLIPEGQAMECAEDQGTGSDLGQECDALRTIVEDGANSTGAENISACSAGICNGVQNVCFTYDRFYIGVGTECGSESDIIKLDFSLFL